MPLTLDVVQALAAAGLGGSGGAEVAAFAASVDTCVFGPGEAIIREGDLDDSLYILMSGRARVEAQGKTLNHLGPGETAGEMALLTGDPRSATVVAAEPTLCARIPRAQFEQLSRAYPEAARRMTGIMLERLRKARLSFALHLSNLFGGLDADVLRDLEAELEMSTLASGDILYRQGEPGDTLAIVVNGKLRVVARREAGEEIAVAELGRGETVGEMAVVSGEPRTATVVAIRDSNIAILSRPGFERLLLKHPLSMTRVVADKLVARLRNMTSGVAQPGRTVAAIALLPAGPGVPLGAFASSLHQSLSRLGRAALLSSESVDRALARKDAAQVRPGDPRHVSMVEWLNRQELQHDYVLYQLDPVLTAWSERCLRQADQVMLVGNGRGDPAIGDMERRILPGRKLILALIQEDRSPRGTLAWLEPRAVERHHHVRLGQAEDFDRVARFLSGKAVGIALGGGFARGLAHLGVIRAMGELGMPVDAVGGTSMGAMVGALWNQGWEHARIIEETCTGCRDSFNDLTFPFVAFKRGKKFSGLMKRFFGDRQIEDLFLPFFCVSANLNRAEVKVHTRGALAKAILASTRAPAVFPPVVFDGELHVDGGVLNNVPVDIMKTFCNGGTVVGVDVSPPHELNLIEDYGDGISGWEAFKRRFGKFGTAKVYVPSILLIVMRTVEFGGISFKKQASPAADIYLRPPLLRFKRTDFHSAADIAETGYRHAMEELGLWLRRTRREPR